MGLNGRQFSLWLLLHLSPAAAASWPDINRNPFPTTSLEFAALIALADLDTLRKYTIHSGTPKPLDLLWLLPGLHLQQSSAALSHGEAPSVAALTSGYVFRVENPAMVVYLTSVGISGQLVTCRVSSVESVPSRSSIGIIALRRSGPLLTLLAFAVMVLLRDWWGLVILGMLLATRILNSWIFRRRLALGWKGASEPGVKGDLLILLSQDRWIRLQGLVDDLKAVTSGEWAREMTTFESFVEASGKLLVYGGAALGGNLTQLGSINLASLLLLSTMLLGLLNRSCSHMLMYDRRVEVSGPPRQFERRLAMVDALIKESGREDWALSLGLKRREGVATQNQMVV